MKIIYFDNNATTAVAPEVISEMKPYFSKFYGNPSSIHSFGGFVEKKISKARDQVANLLGSHMEEIVFTSCGTESNSSAIFSAIKSKPDKKHIVTTRVEHPSIKNLCEYLNSIGYKITFVPVDRNGNLDTNYLYSSISEDTLIVSIMWANNETGVIFPVEEIAEKLSNQDIFFHTDAVQAVGKIPIDMSKNKIDMLSLSGHKFHAPKGIGALYLRNNVNFKPFMLGGHQEKGNRAGTENVASIIGIGKAADIANNTMNYKYVKISKLRDKLEEKLLNIIPKTFVNGDIYNRIPNTTNIAFEYVEGESILLMMEQYGICASSGSACTSSSLQPSHVLKAMKVPFTAAHGSIRFSLSVYNTEDEVNFVLKKIPTIIGKLRKISPYYNIKKNRNFEN